jgi:hypothetical protein
MDLDSLIRVCLGILAVGGIGVLSLWGQRLRLRRELERELERILADA